MRFFLAPRPTRRQKGAQKRQKTNQINLRWEFFWHQGPQEDRKSAEVTETKQINLRWEFLGTKAHKKTERSTEETETKQTNLRWDFFGTKAHKKTERAQKWQKQSKANQLKNESFWTPRPARRQKERRRDRSKANQLNMRGFLTPRLTRRQKEHRRNRSKAKQINLRWEFSWHQGPQEDRKSTEETETKQINLRWEVFWHRGPQEDRKSTEETETKQINLRWEFSWHQGPQEDRKSTEETETKQINLRWEVFWHQGPQEDRKSTEETETKQINLRWEFLDTKAHKKTDFLRAQKRQKQSNQLKMRVFWHQGPQEDKKSTEETETKQINLKQINLRWEFFDTKAHKKDRWKGLFEAFVISQTQIPTQRCNLRTEISVLFCTKSSHASSKDGFIPSHLPPRSAHWNKSNQLGESFWTPRPPRAEVERFEDLWWRKAKIPKRCNLKDWVFCFVPVGQSMHQARQFGFITEESPPRDGAHWTDLKMVGFAWGKAHKGQKVHRIWQKQSKST